MFSDLLEIFYEGLYAGDVSSARIPNVLEQLEDELGEIAGTSSDSMRNWIVGGLAGGCFLRL